MIIDWITTDAAGQRLYMGADYVLALSYSAPVIVVDPTGAVKAVHAGNPAARVTHHQGSAGILVHSSSSAKAVK